MTQKLPHFLDPVDRLLAQFFARHGVRALRISLGVVFLWFGVLKFIPGLSSAEGLALDTIRLLTFGLLPDLYARWILAAWESAVGLGLLFGVYLRAVLFLLALQMAGTFTPLILFPTASFALVPFVPTLEGQYIIKNLVLLAAGMVIGATVRGGGLTEERHREERQARRDSAAPVVTQPSGEGCC